MRAVMAMLETPSEISYTPVPMASIPPSSQFEPHPSVLAARQAWATQKTPKRFAEGGTDDTFWRLFHGDNQRVLKQLPEASVNCVVTSPPYYWQRDYGVEGQFGMESSIDGFVDNLRQTFAGLDRVLAPDGVVFLNLGDTYYSAKGRPHGVDAKHRSRRLPGLRAVDGPGLGLPRKSLIGIPWRVALGLQQDGWTLRSDIIWVRNSAIPEPTAKDRPWRKYEHVFMFAKSTRYCFDRDGLDDEEDVWFIEPERNSLARGTHYAPYPRELVRRCIASGCPEGGVVLDPFVGGGTTMSVALEMGRSAIGIDLNADFCKHVAQALTSPPGASKALRLI
jgi:DNA modification methylase